MDFELSVLRNTRSLMQEFFSLLWSGRWDKFILPFFFVITHVFFLLVIAEVARGKLRPYNILVFAFPIFIIYLWILGIRFGIGVQGSMNCKLWLYLPLSGEVSQGDTVVMNWSGIPVVKRVIAVAHICSLDDGVPYGKGSHYKTLIWVEGDFPGIDSREIGWLPSDLVIANAVCIF